MTNYILYTIVASLIAIASMTISDNEPKLKNHLSGEQKIEIYEQAMGDFATYDL